MSLSKNSKQYGAYYPGDLPADVVLGRMLDDVPTQLWDDIGHYATVAILRTSRETDGVVEKFTSWKLTYEPNS